VTKLSPDGSKLVYSTFLAGSGGDSGAGVAVDSAGSAYVTGSTNSRDFPTMAPFQSAAKASPSAFVTELSPAGNSLVYSTYLGGSTYDAGTAIAVDSSGSAYVTGATESLDFPTTQSAFQPLIDQSLLFANTYTSNAFLTKFNPSGSALVYSTFLGGNNGDEGLAVAADASGSAYVAGLTGSSNFPTKAAFESLYKTSSNFSGFLTKFNASGSALVYSTYLGGSAQDQANGVAVDASGAAYVAGVTFSADFPTANPYQKSNNTPSTPIENYFHNGAAFVAKFLATGTVVYSTYLGGSVGDGASAIAVDATGAAYVTGSAGSPDFPTVSAYQAKMAGKGAAFVTKFSPDGTSLLYSTFLGGSGSDRAVGIALDAAAAAYVTGVATSTDFPTQSPYQAKLPGSKSGFVSKLSQPPAGPIITKVANAEGEGAAIAPNTWVEIKGTDLAPAGDTRTWQGSDFVNGQMPTMLDGVSATVNGQAAYVYYISPTQINILTPPAAISGTVSVVVTYQTASAPFTVPAQTESPSFFVFNGGPYVAATHLNGSYIGPTTLYPGATTPAQPGEIVVLYANGFGPTSATLVAGSSTQIGILSPLPVVTIGGVTATVQFAGLVAPGEYQFNVVVPTSLADGDQTIAATYNGSTTQSGTLITVHQ
jgi:uncharacterized protein (TIGR03437 family)